MKLRLDSLYGPVGTSSIRRHVGHHGTILVQICGVMRKRKYEQKQLEEKKVHCTDLQRLGRSRIQKKMQTATRTSYRRRVDD